MNPRRQTMADHTRKKRSSYQISCTPEAHPPDKITADELSSELQTKLFGCKIYTFEETSSTNDVALQLAAGGALEGTLVIAEKQRHGRGRMGRSWESPKGKSILVSLILRPSLKTRKSSWLNILTAAAASRAMDQMLGISALIRWPNDLVISGKKVAGILTEIKPQDNRVDSAVVGIGINVNMTEKDFQRASLPDATSLRIETGKPISRIEFTKTFIRHWEKTYLPLKKGNFKSLADLWPRLSATAGKLVKVTTENQELIGIESGLDTDAGLMLRLSSGITRKIPDGTLEILE